MPDAEIDQQRIALVPEYWIVDLHRDVVDVHRSPVGNRYLDVETACPGDRLVVPESGLAVDVTELLGL